MQRELPKRQFARSPLVAVLGQVRIASVLSIENYIPAIQEKLRKNGFPRFKKVQVHELTIGPAGPSSSVVDRWEFRNPENTWIIVVTKDAVTLQTSKYEVFERPFETHLRMAIDTVSAAVEPQYTERIGLRYVNLVGRAAGKRFRDYLDPGLLGLRAEKMGVTELLSSFMCRGTTEVGQLIVRCVFVNDHSVLPPDLLGIDLSVDPNLPNPTDRVRAFLDFDHFSEKVRKMDTDELISDFGLLHINTEKAFDGAITNYAKEEWGERLVETE